MVFFFDMECILPAEIIFLKRVHTLGREYHGKSLGAKSILEMLTCNLSRVNSFPGPVFILCVSLCDFA